VARGTLRIYLGAAPGVGKTFAMLNEGRRAKERGVDVVVGLVETHGRPLTAEQVDGLEVVPRRTLTYREATFEEMDTDAVLARRPERALVDELAHSNVPGSRNAKRWQDIEELLEAGIEVISTVNIQHLESLNDVVERITGITQRETVPDAWVRAADQIELIDQTPEALRRRMAHGNIYPPDRIDAALGNYFRVGNLTALRELALLWVADRVEESLQDYRERHGIAGPWETRERVVVALTGAPGGDHLVRRAARMAARSKAELVGVHVRSEEGLVGPGRGALGAHVELLTELGGIYREVTGPDVASSLVQLARAENATQLVIGASRRSRWSELAHGSVANAILREAGGALDVHVISTAGDATQPAAGPLWGFLPRLLHLTPLSRRRQLSGYLVVLLGLPALTITLASVRQSFGFASTALCFLLTVVISAAVGGAVPGALAAVLGFLLLNYYFAPPIHTFTISDATDVVAVVVFLVVAAITSVLVDIAARRAAEANRARADARALAAMAGSLVGEGDPLPDLVAQLQRTFGLDGVAILRRDQSGAWKSEESVGTDPPPRPDAAPLSLAIADDVVLVLMGARVAAANREVLDAFAAQLAVALASRRLHAEASQAEVLARANELRTALLAAVSHDLRTPLASIKASASGLLADDVSLSPESIRCLLETIDTEADRLNVLVGNLLDMSRLQTGALAIACREVGLEEVVAAAVSSLGARADRVEVKVAETLPMVSADPALLERALANIVENALNFSFADGLVRVDAGYVATTGDGKPARVDLRVIDQGRGIPRPERERVFRPFQRLGDNPNGLGVGLGLAVARGFVEAMDGEIVIEDTPGGGTTMVVSLPAVAAAAPSSTAVAAASAAAAPASPTPVAPATQRAQQPAAP
jgi:two-component system sensor histidine kinase KdpD